MKNTKGFTLIELLVVVLIVGILTAVAVPQYRRSVERARVAEALTLIRSIYDSCERLAWEKTDDSCADGISKGDVNIKKLDIAVQGKFTSDNLGIETENFVYKIGNNITATATKGTYTGAKITFTGQYFLCEGGTSGEAANACQVWGYNTWNEWGSN